MVFGKKSPGRPVRVGAFSPPKIAGQRDRKSTRLNSSHGYISYAVFCLKKKDNSYNEWMEKIHDWCISLQLWWGHQIPAWHCGNCSEIHVAREDPASCRHCGVPDPLQQ